MTLKSTIIQYKLEQTECKINLPYRHHGCQFPRPFFSFLGFLLAYFGTASPTVQELLENLLTVTFPRCPYSPALVPAA